MPLQTIRSRIGHAEIIQIVELDISEILGVLIPKAMPEVIMTVPWLKPPYVDENHRMRAVTQAFIVKTSQRILVVDTCVGNDNNIAGFEALAHLQLDFLESLDAAGIDRHAVTDVLCTHLHFGHLGWTTYQQDGQWRPTFPTAKYHFGKTEYESALNTHPGHAMYEAQEISFQESIKPVINAGLANFIERDCDLGDGISVFSTPGHSFGHISVEVDAGSETFIIAGNAMHHPVQTAKPDIALLLDHDSARSSATRHKLLSRLNGSATLFSCAHFCSPSFSHITQDAQGSYVFTGVAK